MLGIFLDTETNGLNALKHRLIEVAFKILDVEMGALRGEYSAILRISKEEWGRTDPESVRVNHFSWEEISAHGEAKEVVAEAIVHLFTSLQIARGTAVFICQNPSFDRAFFAQIIDPDLQEKMVLPYHWLDLASMFWAERMRAGSTPWETGITKDKIAAFYRLPPEAKPHRAMNGVDHLIACYEAVVGFPGLI